MGLDVPAPGTARATADNKSVAGSGRLRRPSSQTAGRRWGLGARFQECLKLSLETQWFGRFGNSLNVK